MRRSVKIVTDSTCDIPAALARKLDVTVVPLNVRFGDENFKDRVDIGSAEFFQRLRSHSELPSTSLPSPGDFVNAYGELVDKYDSIISIHISSRLSGTYQSARAASFEFSGRNITVVDSGSVASALLLLVARAARAAIENSDRDAVMAQLEQDIRRVNIFFVVDTLDYLQRGGRIGKAGRLIGSLLDVKPILTVREGIIDTEAKVRSSRKAFRRVVEIVRNRYESPLMAAVSHADAPELARYMETELKNYYPGLEIISSEIGPVIGTHTGPGCIEVSVL